MVDKRGAQLQPARLPGKPRSRQFAAQPPGFSRITKGGSAGWWRAGLWAGRRSDRGSSGRWRPRTTGPEYQCPPRVAACACGATSSKNNPQLSSQPARNCGRQRRTAAKIADTLFNHAPLRQANDTDRRHLATVWIIRPLKWGRVDRPVRTNRPFCVGDQEYSSVICSARIRTDLLRGSAGRGLAENHLRPAGQPGGHRAKIIAAGQRNTRQLSGQRLLISGERALPPVR